MEKYAPYPLLLVAEFDSSAFSTHFFSSHGFHLPHLLSYVTPKGPKSHFTEFVW